MLKVGEFLKQHFPNAYNNREEEINGANFEVNMLVEYCKKHCMNSFTKRTTTIGLDVVSVKAYAQALRVFFKKRKIKKSIDFWSEIHDFIDQVRQNRVKVKPDYDFVTKQRAQRSKHRIRLLPGQREREKREMAECPICSSISQSRSLALHGCRHSKKIKRDFSENLLNPNFEKLDVKPYYEKQPSKFTISIPDLKKKNKRVSTAGKTILQKGLAIEPPPRTLLRQSREKGSKIYVGSSIFDDRGNLLKDKPKQLNPHALLQSHESLPDEFTEHARKNFMGRSDWASVSADANNISNSFEDIYSSNSDTKSNKNNNGISFFPMTNNNVISDEWPINSKPTTSVSNRTKTAKPGSRPKTTASSKTSFSSPNTRNRRLSPKSSNINSNTYGKNKPTPPTKKKKNVGKNRNTSIREQLAKVEKEDEKRKVEEIKELTADDDWVDRIDKEEKLKIQPRQKRDEDYLRNNLIFTIGTANLAKPVSLVKFVFKCLKFPVVSTKSFKLGKNFKSGNVVIDQSVKLNIKVNAKLLDDFRHGYLELQLRDASRGGWRGKVGDAKIPLDKLAQGKAIREEIELWNSETLDEVASINFSCRWEDSDLSWKMLFAEDFGSSMALDNSINRKKKRQVNKTFTKNEDAKVNDNDVDDLLLGNTNLKSIDKNQSIANWGIHFFDDDSNNNTNSGSNTKEEEKTEKQAKKQDVEDANESSEHDEDLALLEGML